MAIFTEVAPVLSVLDMGAALEFWGKLGFVIDFADSEVPEEAEYAGISRDGLALHLQTLPEDAARGQAAIAVRVAVESAGALKTLYDEWAPHDIIADPLELKPEGRMEFGFYAPDGAAFFFYWQRPES
ncbi:glyoxalase superfamily protein [Pseudoroseicyclus tamaricis]|uniref:VOC domain-containing protein n=1 Tax=Pseudoroseicyclus tamaricis TaxID=2705421 RepID=A0A6B2JM00_9RHOB|nr:glyoxalase superfamily protein [Pseudoroseicyclus tamaricis]NDU99656.1 hypothetical protein [Pseudoroseicyclus tamaricis]